MRPPRSLAVIVLVLLCTALPSAQRRTLDIYWIDVEGGAATLVVSPSGESLLYDAGWEVDGRDGKRIADVVKQAGLAKIDYFVLSHFHAVARVSRVDGDMRAWRERRQRHGERRRSGFHTLETLRDV